MANSFPVDLAHAVFKELKRHGTTDVDIDTLTDLFETLYFASLETEELQPITCYIVYLDPKNIASHRPPSPRSNFWTPVHFAAPRPLDIPNLVKLAKASDPRTSSFAVYPDLNAQGQLSIWGLIDQGNSYHDYMNHDSTAGYQRPGLFQASILGIGHIVVFIGPEKIAELESSILLGKFFNVLAHGKIRAALEPGIQTHRESVEDVLVKQKLFPKDHSKFFHHSQKKWLIRSGVAPKDIAEIFRRRWDKRLADDWLSSLARLLLRVQNFRHGGAILITPDLSHRNLNVRQSIQYPRLRSALTTQAVTYDKTLLSYNSIDEQFVDSADKNMPVIFYLNSYVWNDHLADCRHEIDGTIWFISLLTRVDGLVLMNQHLEVQGFGVLINVPDDDLPEFVIAGDEDATPTQTRPFPFDRFGTRHQTMMRYCARIPNSVGFVISQDGDVRAMTQVDGRVVMWTDIQLQRNVETKDSLKNKFPTWIPVRRVRSAAKTGSNFLATPKRKRRRRVKRIKRDVDSNPS